MAGIIESRLQSLHITLPPAAAPGANYVPYVVAGDHVYISGQLPVGVGDLAEFTGTLGKDFSIEQGQRAARACGLNILAQLKAACGGNLDRVVRCLRLGVFVHSAGNFTDQPMVANGASDLMVEVLGDKGRHSRFAVGVSQLPRGVAVEVDAIFLIA